MAHFAAEGNRSGRVVAGRPFEKISAAPRPLKNFEGKAQKAFKADGLQPQAKP
jgi:hypothetical protein